jgi:hypothetical protein
MRLTIIVTFAVTLAAGCSSSSDPDEVSSRAYQGHESDLDANNFVSVYPETIGTRLDDCHTCHKGATFTYGEAEDPDSVYVNSCDYCHLITHPVETFFEDLPESYADTLNPYGADYLAAGRNKKALRAIEGDDSDGDTFGNADEIADLKYPGDPDSKPGQDVAPRVTLTLDDIKAMDTHEQFLLANSHKQEYDDYASYAGVKLADLVEAAGVDLSDEALEGITVVAPDGYMKTFAIEDVTRQYPAGLYYAGLDDLGAECSFVTYPDTLPEGLTDGGEIPGAQYMLIAFEHNGTDMQPVNLDASSGRINGEGPFRLIVPQSTPGAPDRGSRFSPTTCEDGYDYDDLKDHNAGAMVRGVTAVRVDPLPEGFEDFDHKNDGWPLVYQDSIIVYGHGVDAQ